MNKNHRIVVGVDGSPSSLAALDWAVEQAERTNAFVEVIATWEFPYGLGWASIPQNYDPASEAQRTIDPIVASVRAAHPSVEISVVITEGRPAHCLVESSLSADMLVVGSRGHGYLTGMLIGSTSEYCVAHAKCPVLVMHA